MKRTTAPAGLLEERTSNYQAITESNVPRSSQQVLQKEATIKLLQSGMVQFEPRLPPTGSYEPSLSQSCIQHVHNAAARRAALLQPKNDQAAHTQVCWISSRTGHMACVQSCMRGASWREQTTNSTEESAVARHLHVTVSQRVAHGVGQQHVAAGPAGPGR
jgi:hypothetical protein